MKAHLISAIAALALPLAATGVHAQAASASKPAAAKSAPAKKTAKASSSARKAPAKPNKTAKTNKAAKPVKSAKAAATAAAAAATAAAPSQSQRLSDADLAIAQHIQTGTIPCELGASVTVTADTKNPGFFHVSSGKQRYHMHPVASRTGAIRLEDNRAGAMWLQLGNKSMLMNQKLGQRIADACESPTQRAMAAQLESQPQPALFDTPKP